MPYRPILTVLPIRTQGNYGWTVQWSTGRSGITYRGQPVEWDTETQEPTVSNELKEEQARIKECEQLARVYTYFDDTKPVTMPEFIEFIKTHLYIQPVARYVAHRYGDGDIQVTNDELYGLKDGWWDRMTIEQRSISFKTSFWFQQRNTHGHTLEQLVDYARQHV